MDEISHDWPMLFEMLAPQFLAVLDTFDFINLFCIVGRFSANIIKLLLNRKVKIVSKLEWYIFKHRSFLRYVYNADDLSRLPLAKKRFILKNCDHLTIDDFEAMFDYVNKDDNGNKSGIDMTDIRKYVLAREDVPFEIVQRVFNSYVSVKEKRNIWINKKNKNLLDPADDRLAKEVFQFFDIYLPFSLYAKMKIEQFNTLWNKCCSIGENPFHSHEHDMYDRILQPYFMKDPFLHTFFNMKCSDRSLIEKYLAGVYNSETDGHPIIFYHTLIPFDMVKRYWTNGKRKVGKTVNGVLKNIESVLFYNVESGENINTDAVKNTILFQYINGYGSFFECYFKYIKRIDECLVNEVERKDMFHLLKNENFIRALVDNKLDGLSRLHEFIDIECLYNIEICDIEIQINFYYNIITSILKHDKSAKAQVDREMLEFLAKRLSNVFD